MSNKSKSIPGYVRLGIAGTSGMGATMVVHPLDLIKFRMQLSGEGGKAADHSSWVHAFKNIHGKEGIGGFYAGISAGLLYQAVNTTTRVGTYQILMDRLKKSGKDGLSYQIAAGLTGGLVASFIGTPIQVALVRMTSDGRLPDSERRNYRHVFDALRRIVAEEGPRGIFIGFKPTVLRAMIGNAAQLVSYTQAKEFLINNKYMEDNTTCHLTSSLISGFMFSFVTCPLDVVKTRIQFMAGKTKTPLYSGVMDALWKIVQQEGVVALWKGFGPLCVRVVPHSILLFIFSEKLTYIYKKYFVDNAGSDH